jgi:hypothetical protein
MTKRAALTIAVTLFAVSPTFADTAKVLDLCLNTNLIPEERIEVLQSSGWQGAHGQDALTAALTLTWISAGDPTGWADTFAKAQGLSGEGLREANVTYLESPDARAGVFVGRGRSGLQTCLFLGDNPDLSALDRALDGSIIRTIGEVSRIRGDGVKSLISAHALSDQGREQFTPRLRFGLTFTVELDRQPPREN